jgi:hypothetical protein
MKLWEWIKSLFKTENRDHESKPRSPTHPSNQMDEPGEPQDNADHTIIDRKFFEQYALELTGAFEGSGYGQVTGDFDGQGLSLGILQWCIGQGSLQSSILRPYFKDHSPSNHVEQKLEEISNVGISQGLRISRAYFGRKTPSYKSLLAEFMIKAKPYQIAAARSNFDRAWAYAEQNNMLTLKSYCWFFDITVQNGSLKGIPRPSASESDRISFVTREGGVNKTRWLNVKFLGDESAILCEWTNLRANKNKWRPDVISRKCTIAHGFGLVHGRLFDFRNDFNAYTLNK